MSYIRPICSYILEHMAMFLLGFLACMKGCCALYTTKVITFTFSMDFIFWLRDRLLHFILDFLATFLKDTMMRFLPGAFILYLGETWKPYIKYLCAYTIENVFKCLIERIGHILAAMVKSLVDSCVKNIKYFFNKEKFHEPTSVEIV